MLVSPWPALLGAATTLGLAVLAYWTATLNARTTALDKKVNGTPPAPIAPPVLAAGGRRQGDSAAPERPAPLWDQLADPLPNGTLPFWRWEECGEECCAEVIQEQHGVSVIADALRAQLGGPQRRGLTTGADLVRVLALNNVAAAQSGPGAAQVAAALQAITDAGGSAIVLGHWLGPGVLHWVLVTRADAAGCGANDPWGGRRDTWTWPGFQAAYAGDLVHVTRAPDPGP
jgi:hypothetical protein